MNSSSHVKVHVLQALSTMTILTGGAVGFIVTASGSMIPAAVGTAAGVLMTGTKLWVQAEPLKVALATAIGTGTSAGAIAGAAVTKSATNAVSGAIIGGLSAGGVGSVLAGSLAVGGTLAANPWSLLTVGTTIKGDENDITFDCWKPVVRDNSDEASHGMSLSDMMTHPNVHDVVVTPGALLPNIVIENIWNEKFQLDYVVLRDSEKLYCHATSLNM